MTEPNRESEHRRSRAAAIIATARPRQWVKNLLVFAAPAAAGVLSSRGYFAKAAAAALIFTAMSAGVYFINDAIDRNLDRQHPTKSARPVAAGDLGHTVAYAIGIILGAAALVGGFLVCGRAFGGILVAYSAISVSYAVWLKKLAVVDMLAVASGFILRAIGGGVATGVPISQWFLIVVSFGSLFVVSGKRYAEHATASDGDHVREVLKSYSSSYLHFVRALAASVMVLGYCLWAFERAQHSRRGVWIGVSIAPFVAIVMRYALLLDQGAGEIPEEIVLRDRAMQLMGLALVATLAVGIYGA